LPTTVTQTNSLNAKRKSTGTAQEETTDNSEIVLDEDEETNVANLDDMRT